ncbi:MAG: hypothetical protein SFT81_07545 [Candidatus Caenarcaniphilales bacterium]|nr:hypothetical protein [Candidatus Caenarcaniphilales bacterium]
MNLRTRLESKESQWIRVHFPDSSYITGRLQHVGSDFIQLECFGREDASPSEPAYSQHIIPLGLIKFFTIETSTFLEAERRRLEFISQNTKISEHWANNLPELEQ